MAYTTPLKVFQSMERIERHEETFSSVSDGDALNLSAEYIVKDTETVIVDGNTQDSSNYTVNFDTNSIEYSGSDTGDATIKYKSGPYNNATVEDKIAAAEDHIKDYTNTVFDGRASVTDEIYDGGTGKNYVFDKRPVRNVLSVQVNEPEPGSNPSYTALSEGLGNDYVEYKDLGIRFLQSGKSPSNDPEDVKVSYEYGYEDVPADLKDAATIMVVDDLIRGTVSGAMVDGRDNFDPQTVNVQSQQWQDVLDRYKVERVYGTTELAVRGEVTQL